jgi:mRNA interferase RelE/StbE
MPGYKVVFKKSVEKDLSSLPKQLIPRIWQRCESLKNEPFPRQAIKLEGSEGLYRLRVGDYRIVYGVDADAKEVIVHYVRHRREVYRGI